MNEHLTLGERAGVTVRPAFIDGHVSLRHMVEGRMAQLCCFRSITAKILGAFLLWAWHGEALVNPPVAQLPDCTKTTVISGEVIQEEVDTKKISIASNLRLNLGLRETACLYVQTQDRQVRSPDSHVASNFTATANSSLNDSLASTIAPSTPFPYNNGTVIYVIQYVSLIQLHPVRQRYEFGIPYLESKCVCDCPGGADHCPVGYQYKNCTSGPGPSTGPDGVCVTTYFAHQPATGCVQGQESELCCELSARPHENRRYTALYIGQPDAVAEFRYQLYTAAPDGSTWTRSTDETFRVSLNKHQRLEFPNDRLQVRVSGTKPFYQLKDGMYFYENAASFSGRVTLRDGVPLNELHEYDLGRLGWFRRRNGKWTVRNAWVRLQDAHKIQVKNCKDQTYSESFNAEYLVSSGDTDDASMPVLGHDVAEEEPWVDEVKVELDGNDQARDTESSSSRNAHRLLISHKDSNPIEIDLTMDSHIQLLKTVYHSSALIDFSGSIQIDRLSNRYLNLTLIGARGTLIGSVYKTITRQSADLAFSHYITGDGSGAYKAIIALPAQVNASRWVCIHPLDRLKDEICKWLLFEMVALDDKETPQNGLTAQRGQCDDCNEITVQNFLHYLNPLQWFNGISSPAEALAMGVELLFYGALVLIAIALCRRLACPIVRWAVCGGEPCWPAGGATKRTSAGTPAA